MHVPTTLIANWNYPTAVYVGAGRISELAEHCKNLNMQAPLFVTDPGLASLPMVKNILEHCREAGLTMTVFSGIKTNPTGENISQGIAAFREGKHDGVIAFGGGSAIDAGKAIAMMIIQERPLWDFEDVGDNWKRVKVEGMVPVIAIPTTAGTGAEVGRSSVITDQKQQIKKIIFHPKMLPKAVILDPQLTISLPPQLTAATGMDALSHNLEAYCTTYYHPLAEGIAVEGIRLVKEYLPRAVADGKDIDARTQMLTASAMGATAFQRGLGAMHALAHPLGAIYDAHHGLLNAILMPYVLRANRTAIEKKIARLAAYLQIANGFDGFLNWILKLREQIGIPTCLAEIGIDGQSIERLAKMATQDAAAASNPIQFSEIQYRNILYAAVHGDLTVL